MRRIILILSILAITVCSGCTYAKASSQDPDEEPSMDIATLGFDPVFEYEYIEQTPAIITDRVGYSPAGKKVFYIEGSDLDKTFQLVDANTEETVYDGRLHRLTDDKASSDATTFYVGDFSDVNTSGTFRVYQPDVGYSYEFTIDSHSHDNMYREAYKTVTEAEYMQTSALIYTLSTLMLTHEIYSDSYVNDAFIKGGVEELLHQQHPRTGAVYQDLQSEETLNTIVEELSRPSEATIQTDTMISLSATAELAGMLAQYYCDYYEADPVTAGDALKASVKAYNFVDRYRDSVKTDSLYFASSELYRATGQYKYRKAIADYDLIPEQTRTCSEYDYTMLADVAYLSSGFKTDYVRCESLMAHYRDLAGQISSSVSRQNFYVQADIDDLSEEEILYNMMTLGLVSYVLSGREYASIQANYLHYLFGINRDMTNYYLKPLREGDMPLSSDIIGLSKLIFILGNGE